MVPPADSARVLGRVSSRDVTEILLENSFHVATLDHDAPRVFEESAAFLARTGANEADSRPEGEAVSG